MISALDRASWSPRGTAAPVVGVVGGGQLARMTQHAASRLGITLVVLDPDPAAPAVRAGAIHQPGSPTSLIDLAALAERCDVVTLDHEGVPAHLLEDLERRGHRVAPGAAVVRLGQDKAAARRALEAAGFPVPRFVVASSPRAAAAAVRALGPKVVAKAATGGYDGRGVWLLDAPRAAEALAREVGTLVIEERVPFVRELAVIVARSADGTHAVYPTIETVQRDGMCSEVRLPARTDPAVSDQARALSVAIATHLDLVGLLAVELFDLGDRVVVNELAARPHNSGHLTIEACVTSQFEQHLRAVLGLPLGDAGMVVPHASMVNLVGPADGSEPAERLASALAVPGAHVHLYGKVPRPGRKLGHVTAVGPEGDRVRAAAWTAAAALAGRTERGVGRR